MPKHDRPPKRNPRNQQLEQEDVATSSRFGVGESASKQRVQRTVRRRRMPEAPGRHDPRIRGIVGDESVENTSRAGDDNRKRGWYWHWNSIITQYAPLIGLKGVGLLNSYTVWTDRREESPYRGYAFPSQQSEADFYGEDRAELITINKILVALDLIEIRKEMVLRTDEKGRKWRVPHNFYRVKDQGNGFTLTSDAVSRVVDLAERDANVYRYVRRIFSARFAPIDPANIWNQILEELQPTEAWQRLTDRTRRTEQRASARSKAGHASRRAQTDRDVFSLPSDVDSGALDSPPTDTSNDTSNFSKDSGNDSSETSVAETNNGSGVTVDEPNNGLPEDSAGIDAKDNNGWATSVQPSNRTYHQALTTTTRSDHDERTRWVALPDTPPEPRQSARDRAFRQFEEANERKASLAEQRLMKVLAADLEERADLSSDQSWHWIGDAIDEAVAAGSTFVAPRRIQEIVMRWSREGRNDKEAARLPQRPDKPVTRRERSSHSASQKPVTRNQKAGHISSRSRVVPAPPRRGDAIRVGAFELPECALTNHQVWNGVIDELERSGAVARVDIDAWIRMSMIVDVREETLVVGVPNVLAERRAATRYRAAFEHAVERVTGVSFSLEIILGDGSDNHRESAQASGA